MSHTIASVSQATYLPKEHGPGISAVQSQTSFGFEDNDAFERASKPPTSRKSKKIPKEVPDNTNPLYRLVMALRGLLKQLKRLLLGDSLS